MGPALAFVYALGAVVTAVVVMSGRVSGKSKLASAVPILLWPFYWIWFGVLAFRARS
jgi:hypothetical protein